MAPMAWMAADQGPAGLILTDGLMPGMATEAELAKLRASTGRDFDIL
jgi:hypothetical protein